MFIVLLCACWLPLFYPRSFFSAAHLTSRREASWRDMRTDGESSLRRSSSRSLSVGGRESPDALRADRSGVTEEWGEGGRSRHRPVCCCCCCTETDSQSDSQTDRGRPARRRTSPASPLSHTEAPLNKVWDGCGVSEGIMVVSVRSWVANEGGKHLVLVGELFKARVGSHCSGICVVSTCEQQLFIPRQLAKSLFRSPPSWGKVTDRLWTVCQALSVHQWVCCTQCAAAKRPPLQYAPGLHCFPQEWM